MFDVQGRSVVVTGGLSGIGAAIARRLQRAGAKVLIGDLTDDAALAADWGCDFQRTDIADTAAFSALLDRAVDMNGRLDALVNNAGAAGIKPMAEANLESAGRYMRINALGTLAGIREAALRMKRGGSIVNIAALSAVRGTPGWGEYAMSKAAIISLTQTSAIELGPRGIRVNAISPGAIETPLSIAINGDALSRAMKVLSPLGREGKPEEIASTVHFLVSDDAGYVTGQNWCVDGGWSIGTTVASVDAILGSG